MRHFVTVLAGGALLLAMTMPALAQSEPGSRPARPHAASGPAGDRLKAEAEKLHKVLKELNLTADQQKQVDQILETNRQANVNWLREHAQELKDLRAKLEEAHTSKQPEAIKAAHADMEKLQASHRALHDALIKQLGDVLTKEQMDTLRKAMAPRGPFEQLDLTPEQRQQVEKIMQDARDEAQKAPDEAARAKIMKDATEKIRTTVLTDEQRKKLAELPSPEKLGPLGDLQQLRDQLKLTDDQKAKIEEIVKDVRQNLDAAEGPARRKVIQDAWKKIQDLLTPEQKAQWEKWRQEHRGEGMGAKLREGIRKRHEPATTQAG